jgi:transcriptional regulator with XRE-family HTH domain
LEDLRGKMSLREAAAKSGLSHTYIRDIELGMNRKSKTPIKPSVETLKCLAEAYNYPYEDLLKKAGYLNDLTEEKKEQIDIADLMNKDLYYKGKKLSLIHKKALIGIYVDMLEEEKD